jgi:small subunit ribosomal protein S5
MGQRVSARDLELGEEKVVRVNRTSAVVKGGRRFSFAAIVVIGDRRGTVGWGQGKAREVPVSIEKAVRDARKNLVRYPLRGDTIPHSVWGFYRSARVFLGPAAPGTGIKAGASVRAVVEELGVRNILTKVYGSRNPLNVVKAVMNGLDQLLSKKQVFEARGLPVHPDREGPKLEPVGIDDSDRPRKRDGRKPKGDKGDRRGGRGRRGRGDEAGATAAKHEEATPATDETRHPGPAAQPETGAQAANEPAGAGPAAGETAGGAEEE